MEKKKTTHLDLEITKNPIDANEKKRKKKEKKKKNKKLDNQADERKV